MPAARPPPPDAPPSAGRWAAGSTLGGFRIERLLARGANGAVYLARERSGSGRAVALKVLELPQGDDGGLLEARRRFLREAGIAARLHHPDIVAVHGAGTEGDVAFVAMELLPGADLRRYTGAARLLPEPLALRVAARVADALAHAHAQGVVHRDVKPANVMVDLPRDRVAVTDFGVARIADGSRTRTGLVLGTPGFMSPEQLAGSTVDGRSDLYSVGVLLFQLLSGRLPHEADSLGRLLQAIATAPPPALGSLRPGVPPALDALLARALQKAPAARHADGHSLAADLRAIADAWPSPAEGSGAN